MKLNDIFIAGTVAIAPALAQNYHCYGSGAVAITGAIYDHAKNACQGWSGNRGALQGWFAPGEARRFCVNNLAERIEFFVTNLNTQQGFDLDDGDCLREFEKINDLCDFTILGQPGYTRGGERTNSGWFFK